MRLRAAAVVWPLAVLAILVMAGSPAYGQSGNTTTLSGVVVDDQGAVVPGADIVAKNNATAITIRSVTDGTGRFVLAGVPPGAYTVTVSLMGFKTAILPDVQVLSATPASVKVQLKVGTLEETVVVTGQTEIVQATSPTVSTTIAVKQIQQLPVITHTALDFVVTLPGVETSGLNFRGSTVNGLSTYAINITLDGINVQDKRGSEGMFMYIRPMMDSVEEVTVSTSNSDAAATGAGGVNIRMETRSGSNRFSGSVYNTWRNQAGTNEDDVLTRKAHPGWLWSLNTPYWFDKRDKPKTAAGDYFLNDVRLTTPGFRVGGPIVKDKLFYFFNYEEFRLPQSITRTRYVLTTSAQVGLYSYPAADGSGTKTINLLTDIAAKYGQTATVDPAIAKLLADIRTAAAGDASGAFSPYDGFNVEKWTYGPSATSRRRFPTLRLDYNVTNTHRLSFTYRYNEFDGMPDMLNSAEPRFPGFPNQAGQYSQRYMWQVNLRSTLGKSLVNEVRGGTSDAYGDGTYFGKGVNPAQFNCTGIGCQMSNGVGYNWTFPALGGVTMSGATAYGASSAGVAAQVSLEDTLTWLKGRHSLSFGGSYSRTTMRNTATNPYQMTLGFGTASNDTVAYNMLGETSGNFPGGISPVYVIYARNLYGFLTGRVTGITSNYYLQPDGSYIANGQRENGTIADDIGFFASDSWRVRPSLTLTLGVRYQVQLPMTTDGLYSRPQTWQMVYGVTGAGAGLYGSGNLYKPGVMTGTAPVIVKYENDRPAYNTDWNNVAPSVGAAWRPALKEGFLSKILSRDPVFRGGYSLTYTRLGTAFFDSNYNGNPGRSRTGSRTATSGAPVLGYDGWPVLMRDAARIHPSAVPAPLVGDWTLTPSITETVDIHYPDWPIPQTHQYSVGFQRELGKSTALDIRYVGNTEVGGWASWNMTATPQWSMLNGENEFYDEFRRAQANLRANIIAGKGYTFAYTGAPGTSPLPIFMAYLQGIPLADLRNQNPASYTAPQFSTMSWYNQVGMYNANLTGISGTSSSGLQYGIATCGTSAQVGFDCNRIAAGLPVNFFIANPTVAQGNAWLETTSGNTRYNSIQIELRRRMSAGFLVQGSYVHQFGRKSWMQRSLREDWFYVNSTGGPDHAVKASWVYELPFGRGKRWGSGVSALVDGFIGGWEIDGVARFQSGLKSDYGTYRLVGMTEGEFADMFKFYHVIDPTVKDANGAPMDRVYMLPQDVIQQSIIALYQWTPTTATGYVNDVVPTGRYLAPPNGPDCVQYYAGQCPGTKVTRIVTGPMFWKVDLSFVKRIPVYKNIRVEARMDLYNAFNTINYTSNWAMGATVLNWQVTAAAAENNTSQDPGGRITSFGLRVTW
jgi:hypothetical protein